jgi:hypothetical protein
MGDLYSILRQEGVCEDEIMRIAEAGSDLEIHASDFLGSRYVMLVVWLCSSREWCFRAIPLGTPKIHDSIAGLSRLKGCLIRFSLPIADNVDFRSPHPPRQAGFGKVWVLDIQIQGVLAWHSLCQLYILVMFHGFASRCYQSASSFFTTL